jgi:hypothetical protein
MKVSLFHGIKFAETSRIFFKKKIIRQTSFRGPTVEIVVELHPNVKYATPAPIPRMKNIKAQ